jgi:putative DNA primase/helicase
MSDVRQGLGRNFRARRKPQRDDPPPLGADRLHRPIISPAAVIIIFYGSGANAKTRLVATIQLLVSPEAVYATRIEDLDKNRFAIGNLAGKRLFIDDDVQAGTKLPDGILKKISERKVLTGERKFGPMFNFVCRAVPVLIANDVPSLPDTMYGMVRRLQIIPMTRRFTAKERDPALFDRIWATEFPGIAAKAVRGWMRLQRRGKFKLPREMRAMRQEWLAHANPLRAFVAECIERDRDATAGYQAVYEAYQNYCARSGITRVQQKLRV